MAIEDEKMTEEWDAYRRDQAEGWLKGVAAHRRRVDALRAAVEAKRAELDGLHGMDYSRPVVSATASDDAMTNAVYRVTEAIRDYCAELTALTAEQADANQRLASMTDATGAAALSMHYLAGIEWAAVADRLGYSERHLYRIRDDALVEAYEIMPPGKREPLSPAL
ncbi:MAG: hypothetical protein ACI364_03550 [Coriobacteriales bacterium]